MNYGGVNEVQGSIMRETGETRDQDAEILTFCTAFYLKSHGVRLCVWSAVNAFCHRSTVGLVVEYMLAMHVTRVRFPDGALLAWSLGRDSKQLRLALTVWFLLTSRCASETFV